jgi:hypothetical protein
MMWSVFFPVPLDCALATPGATIAAATSVIATPTAANLHFLDMESPS